MRLTPFAKLFVALVICGAVAYVTLVKKDSLFPAKTAATNATGRRAPSHSAGRIVVGVNDFGGGYPLVLANDGAQAGPASLFSKAGLDVEVRLIRGSKERLKAFDDGEVHVMLLTLDYLANLAPVYKAKGIDLRSFLFVDWSRGNIGIAAKKEITSIEGLKGARIATTRNTPTHYLLFSLLDKSNLLPADIDAIKSSLIFATKTPEAGALFQRGEADAVAIWEPHLSESIADGRGTTLVTTETATNLIGDVLFARKDWLDTHRDEAKQLVAAYFLAVDDLEKDPSRAIALSAAAFQQKPDLIRSTLGKIKPAHFADNRAFFGLETEDCAYDQLYSEAAAFWLREGLIKEVVPATSTKWLGALEALSPTYRDQKVVEAFRFLGLPQQQSASLLTKSVSIYFGSAQSALDPNARKILDGLAATLAVFQNAYVQVEGNTDAQGNDRVNQLLSQARAEAVVTYLVERHRLDRSRFVALGNGETKPVAPNTTPEGRELNRRTEFKIFKNASAAQSAANQSAAAPASSPAAPRPPAVSTKRGAADPLAGPSPSLAPTPPPVPQGSTSGQLLAAQISSAMRQNIRHFQGCYEKAVANKPNLAGKVILAFSVQPGGQVKDASVASSTLDDAQANACFLTTIRSVAFPASEKGVTRVTYPLVFSTSR